MRTKHLFLFAMITVQLQAQGAAARHEDPVEAAVASEDWAKVESLARAATLKSRRDAVSWTYLGLAQDHLGKDREAVVSFQQAAQLDPQAPYVHTNLGAAYEADRQDGKAALEYRRSLELDGHQPAALVNLARLLSASGTGHQAEAEALLGEAWALAPDAEMARSLLLLAPCAAGRVRADSAVSRVKPYVDKILADVPLTTAPTERLRVAHAMLACGFSGESAGLYETLLQRAPDNVEATLGLAQAQVALDEPQKAGLTLERRVAAGMENASIYALLAHVYDLTGHSDHAVEAMKRALQLAPSDAGLRFRYCMLLLNTHAPKAAELRSREALQIFPASAQLWFALGLSQFDQTDPAAAQQSFDRAIAFDPRFVPALAYRGLCALDQQRYSEAENWYRKAIQADPSAADLHLLLAEALERQRPSDTHALREQLGQALALDPKLAGAFLTLSRIDLQDDQAEDAIVAAHRALELDPTLRQAHFNLARAYRHLHRPEQAAAESQLFSEQRTSDEAASHEAFLAKVRQLSATTF